jgi:hypothetical protein
VEHRRAKIGGGKSYFVGWMAEKLYEARKRFIILDTKTKNHIADCVEKPEAP